MKMLSILLSTGIFYHALCFINLIVGLYFVFFFKLPALMDNKLKRKTLSSLSNLEFN